MKINSEHLFTHSKAYNVLKKITSFYHSIYYEEICILNDDNIPKEDPVIFTPNHQNALMDALAIIYTTERQPVFMARADIFKKDLAKKILTFLKIIPVYRIRDGVEALSKNDSTFELAFQVLKQGGSVGIMPEGNHGDQRRLRPLKKGVARLAIQAQELLETQASIKIVPVGLEFSTYQGFRGNLLVNFGKPIEISEFLEEYKTNSAKGLQSIRTRLTEALKAVMINVETDEFYATIMEARELYALTQKQQLETYCDKFLLDKKSTDALTALATQSPDQLSELKHKLRDLNNASKDLKISPWVISWNPPKDTLQYISDIARYVVFFPAFVFAAAFHAVPYFISEHYSNKVEDKQFVSSMRFVSSFLLYFLWYLIILFVPYSFLLKLILLVTMPVLGVMSFDYWDSLKKTFVKYEYLKLKRQNSKALQNVRNLHQEIIQWLTDKIDR